MPTNGGMTGEPQSQGYRPVNAIADIADFLGDEVAAATFPQAILRFRNDRAAGEVGLSELSDADWVAHFGRFTPLAGTLPRPLALRYHGHQFQTYNPDLGDGRGFLFAQMLDRDGRLMDLGTKGSGTTPYSRAGDGRLTLKGAVREILATETLEALGVTTSRTFSVIETGEALERGDEPSPTRSAVMVRLSHGHIRIGSFQRLSALGQTAELARLVEYCLHHFPGPDSSTGASGNESPAVRLMTLATTRMADLAASYMVAGFVHGVLNTDNINITGESFDYGPWRFLPRWDPAFTAAYFDHQGLYAFARQPEAIRWNLGQLAIALRPLSDAAPLIAAFERFGPLYEEALLRRFCWRLGIAPRGREADAALLSASEQFMRESGMAPDRFFFGLRRGKVPTDALADMLDAYGSPRTGHNYWRGDAPQSLLIEEVERIWSAIEQRDDWQPLHDKVAALRVMGEAMGRPPASVSRFATP